MERGHLNRRVGFEAIDGSPQNQRCWVTARQELPLLIASDDGYLFAAAVTVKTVAERLDASASLHVFAYLEGAAGAERLADYCRGLGVTFTIVRDADLSERSVAALDRLAVMNSRVPRAINARYAMPELLAGRHQRAVYTDVDIAAVADVGDLWDLDLDGRAVGAVMAPSDIGTRRLPQIDRYFNSGVLLIDVDAWTEQDIGHQIMTAMMGNPSWAVFDQDAANAVLADEAGAPLWHELPPGWNAATPFFTDDRDELMLAPPGDDELRFVHFAGGLRQQTLERHPYGAAFLDALADVPFDPPARFHARVHGYQRLLRRVRRRLATLRA